jgi:hypothetical protein
MVEAERNNPIPVKNFDQQSAYLFKENQIDLQTRSK